MITTLIITTIFAIVSGLFLILPTIPPLPSDAFNAIDTFSDMIFGGWNIFTFFVRPTTIFITVPIAIGIVSFDHIYKGIMFILKKIPFINVS